ncbi:MAG: hypothetical protein IJY46_06420, partial [Lentisphaeria bacterium]|nr:hypothetical protein [Lentisphaeria bacterium]
NNASSSGVFYEAFCGAAAKYEALCVLHASGVSSAQKHEAALRAMKRSLTASCFFALESRQKNGRPFSLNSEFSLKLKWLRIYIKWLSLR